MAFLSFTNRKKTDEEAAGRDSKIANDIQKQADILKVALPAEAEAAKNAANDKRSNFQKVKDVGKDAGKSAFLSYTNLGNTLGTIASSVGGGVGGQEEAADSERKSKLAVQHQLLDIQYDDKSTPEQKARAKSQFQKLAKESKKDEEKANKDTGSFDSKVKDLSVKKTAGDLASVVTDVLSGGTYGQTVKGAKTGKLLWKPAEAAAESFGKTVAKNAATGAAWNVGGDAIQQQLDDQKGTSFTELAAQGTLGAVLGSIGGAVEGLRGKGKAAGEVVDDAAKSTTQKLLTAGDSKAQAALPEGRVTQGLPEGRVTPGLPEGDTTRKIPANASERFAQAVQGGEEFSSQRGKTILPDQKAANDEFEKGFTTLSKEYDTKTAEIAKIKNEGKRTQAQQALDDDMGARLDALHTDYKAKVEAPPTMATEETGFTLPKEDVPLTKDQKRLAELDKQITDAQQNGTTKTAEQMRTLMHERNVLNAKNALTGAPEAAPAIDTSTVEAPVAAGVEAPAAPEVSAPVEAPAATSLSKKDQVRLDEIDQQIGAAQQMGTADSAETMRMLMRERNAIRARAGITMGAEVEPSPSISAEVVPSGRVEGEPDITPKSVEEAKVSVASAQPSTVDKAKAAVAGAPSSTGNSKVAQGTQTIAQKLDAQNQIYGGEGVAAPEEIVKQLGNSESVATPARKHDWLNHYEDTQGVLGRHFGNVGTDIGYKLSQGAKVVADIQEFFRPDIKKIDKLVKKVAKTKAGRDDLGKRLEAALEDPENISEYIHTADEKQIYESMAKTFDWFKQKRVELGKGVIEGGYSPRAQIRSAVDAPEKLLGDVSRAFGTDVKSSFSKSRTAEEALDNANILDLFPRYISSQAKEFGYEDAMNYAVENLPKTNPVYLTDQTSRRNGEKYLQNLFTQVLDPPTISGSERKQNNLLANSYSAQLLGNIAFSLKNKTQAIFAGKETSREANKLAGQLDRKFTHELQKELTTGDASLVAEGEGSTSSLLDKFKKIDPGSLSEKSNVNNAFNKGVAQQVVEDDRYKRLVKNGMKPKEAAQQVLETNKDLRDLAIRRGNTVVNDTQFGSNFITKPEFFRESGTLFGVSKKWFKQYKRFPMAMMQNVNDILNANDARALDILRRGDPRQTPLVDYLKSAQALQSGVKDIVKGIKSGEITDVSPEVAEGYLKTLDDQVKKLNKEIKGASKIRAGKTARRFTTMWGAAAAIQFLFDGGLHSQDKGADAIKSAVYASPVGSPDSRSNPLNGVAAPSSPFTTNGFDKSKLLNFVPVVGPVVNRGKDVKKFIDTITGS